jgi:hypothetical protein
MIELGPHTLHFQNSDGQSEAFESYQDLSEGDLIECFDVEIIKRLL